MFVRPKPEKPVKKTDDNAEKVVATNRSASFHYLLLDKVEAGMVLRGTEVKSLREGKANLRDAYAAVKRGEVWLINLHISSYLPGGIWNHESLRPRKLLLKRREIDKLIGKTEQKGLTLIPLRIYFRKGIAKCEIAVARGKKVWDRRQELRDKETRREIEQAVFRSRRR